MDYIWTVLRQTSRNDAELSTNDTSVVVLDASDTNFVFPESLALLGDRLLELHFTRDNSCDSDTVLRLPPSIGRFQSLHFLDLRGNPLNLAVDKSIFELKSIKRLYLADCALTVLPSDINRLRELEYLDLEGNCLADLPDALFDVTSLVDLHLSGNGISHFSSKFNELKHLVKLDLSRNSLRSFPEIFVQNSALKKLILWDNLIVSLPETIGNLRSLSYFDISQNFLTSLPDGIGDLRNLSFLNCSMNSITALPETITQLDLDPGRFVLDRNPLQRPPLQECVRGIETIRGYFAALNSFSGYHSNRVKLILLGESMAGKTSLTSALVQCKAAPTDIDKRTVGIDLHRWKIQPEKDNLEALVVDCAGQRKYIITHQFFISQGSLFLLVVDLFHYETSDACYQHTVGNWIDLTLAHVPDATIIVVPTHLDLFCHEDNTLVFEKCKHIMDNVWEDDNARQLAHQMRRKEHGQDLFGARDDVDQTISSFQLLSSQSKGRHISAILKFDDKVLNYTQSLTDCLSMIPVSSRGGLESVADLRDEIVSVMSNTEIMPLVGREVPNAWVSLEEYCIEMQASTPVIEYSKFAKVAMEKFGLTNEMVLSALRYLDTTGSILYFNYVRGLDRFVFLNPRWFVNVIKLLFCHNQGELLEYDPRYRLKFNCTQDEFLQAKENLLENARLNEPLLRCIWSGISMVAEDKDVFYTLVDILDHFGLLIKLDSRQDLLDNETLPMLLPWYLKSSNAEEIESYWPSLKAESVCEVICQFESVIGPIPVGSFERFLADCYRIVDGVVAWEDALLVIQPDCKVLCTTNNKNRCGKFLLKGRCKEGSLNSLWKILLHLLKVLEKFFKQLPGLGYIKCRSICPSCISKGIAPPHMFSLQSWFTWKDVKELVPCPKERVSVPRQLLLPPKDVIRSFEAELDNKTLADDIAEDPVKEKMLFKLAEKVGLRHMQLGRCLGLSHQKLEEICYKFPNQLTEQIIEILVSWQQAHGDDATQRELYKNIEDMTPRAQDLLDFVKNWVNK